MSKIVKNAAQCSSCLEIIESTHRHHFNVCKCWRESVEEEAKLPENATHEERCALANTLTGIAVDGGKDYLKRMRYGKSFYIEKSIYEEDTNDEKNKE